MNVEQLVTLLEGHGELGGAPHTNESGVGIGVITVADVLVEERSIDVLKDARSIQREREFLTASVRQHGMGQISGW